MDKPVSHLIHGLFEAGLLQVGVFRGENGQTYYLEQRFELLPSYPKVLSLAAEMMVRRLPSQTSRLICSPSALALGIAMSITCQIPLVWYAGETSNIGRDFIGAYDIEHPSVFIMYNSREYDVVERQQLTRDAHRVGLQIHHWLSLIDEKSGYENSTSLIHLADAVQEAVRQGLIPAKLAEKALAP